MISNYLEDKYPNEGYKKHVSCPSFNRAWVKPWVRQTKEQFQEEQQKEEEHNVLVKQWEAIEKYPCTNVCSCGEEWEDRYATYQDGCYPYLEKLCRTCSIEADNKVKELSRHKALREKLERFDELIPPRYRGKLVKPIHDGLLTANCSIVWGGFGTGKTWEGYSVAKELMKNGLISKFRLITQTGLLNEMKNDFDTIGSTREYYKNIDLLIVDEVGKVNDSMFNASELFEILNYRYDWEKKTILICNSKNREEVKELMPTAILDRFRECVVEMNGVSKRYQEK